MRTLKNCIKLSSIVKIYVPSTINVNNPVDNSIWIQKTMNLLSKEFGGSTASDALGAWVDSTGSLVKEKVTIVLSFCNKEDLSKSIDKIYDFCLEMKKELSQEAVSLEINGELYLV